MPIVRTPIIDDDLSGTTGTPLDNAWKQEFYNQIDALVAGGSGVEQIAVSASGAIALSEQCATHILFTSVLAPASATITWTKATRKTGDRVIVMGRSTGVILVPNDNVSGGLNVNIVTSAPTPIAQNGVAIYTCTAAGYWALTTHEQGAWIVPAFNAANFVGASGMTWTVAAGNVTRFAYRLAGRELLVTMQIGGTTIGGTPSAFLQVLKAAYGGFAANTASDCVPFAYAADGAGIVTGLAVGLSGNINLQKVTANWVAGAGAVYVQPRFEVV